MQNLLASDDEKQRQIDAAWAEWNAIPRSKWHKAILLKQHRDRLAEAQNWRCCWCHCEMTMMRPGERQRGTDATIEHILPRARGGSDDLDNIAISCASCNSQRGRDIDLTGLVQLLGNDLARMLLIEAEPTKAT